MKRKLMVWSVLAAVGLWGCSSSDSEETVKDSINVDASTATPSVSIDFVPTENVIPLPNDILLPRTADGTIEIPDEMVARVAKVLPQDGQPAGPGPDFGNPELAIGALDGWSLQMPWSLDLDRDAGLDLDSSTFAGNIRIFTLTGIVQAGVCEPVMAGGTCEVTGELSYGSDYVVQQSGDKLNIVPLHPLAAATPHLLVVTNGVLDSDGNPMVGSAQYNWLSGNDPDNTVGYAPLITLNEILLGYHGAAATQGINPANIVYSSMVTTQSNSVATFTAIKAMLISSGIGINVGSTEDTSLPGTLLYTGSMTVPYYLSSTAPLSTPWKAACTSGYTVALLNQQLAALDLGLTINNLVQKVDKNESLCQSLSGNVLHDYKFNLLLLAFNQEFYHEAENVLDPTERHMTGYNFIPEKRSDQTIDVQISYPSAGSPPYPVVILQHGITSKKEDMMGMIPELSAAGFATVAIDFPLHGSRGFTINGEEVNATTHSPTDYLNLNNLLVGRDNLRQSVADMLALRYALSNVTGGPSALDASNVYVMGASLGAMMAQEFVAMANTPVDPDFSVKAAGLAEPGGGIAPLLLDSDSFGPLVRGSVLLQNTSSIGKAFNAYLGTNSECSANLPSDPTAAAIALAECEYPNFEASQGADGLAAISSVMLEFAFAAQTVVDAGDPNNYAEIYASTNTPTVMHEIVGNGVDVPADTVIPNKSDILPFGGTEPLAQLMGLVQIDSNASSGLVKFTAGFHASLLYPDSQLQTPTSEAERRSEIVSLFSSDNDGVAPTITISDTTYIQSP